MKVSELLEALEEILEVDGDWPVYAQSVEDETRFEVEDIQIDHRTKLVILE